MRFDIPKLLITNKCPKCILFLFEFILVYLLSFIIIKCFYAGLEIRALHLDDLHNLVEYIKSPNLFDWIIPFHENRVHYRPVFYPILFTLIKIIGTNVRLTLLINFCIYSFITTALYFLARAFNLKRIFAFSIIFLALIINFNYYEIYQLIGFIEGLPMLFSIAILVISIKYVKTNKNSFNRYTYLLAVIYLLMVFTHERYFPMLLLPIIAVSYNKNLDLKIKSKAYIIFIIELLFFFIIRYYHLRIWIPSGTDCTSLVDNFNLNRSIIFIGHQIGYLCGINLGPEYLCGKHFSNTAFNIQILIIISLLFLLGIVALYVVSKIINKKDGIATENYIDLLFILHIFLCILQSSLTIRVELRWLLASFIGLMFYIAYMIEYILNSKSKKVLKSSAIVVFTLFFASRSYLSVFFKNNNIRIFLINQQDIYNNLYDATVGKYGIEKIKNSKILITNDLYKTIIEEEKYHFFDQYDHNISENQILYIYDRQDENINIADYDIFLVETEDLNFQEALIK